MGNSMEDRFRFRTGPRFASLAEGVQAGGLPHHSFHVFCIYPWIGLLTENRQAEHALTVLDRCRIRWGRVTALQGDQAVVESRALAWDGRRLELAEPAQENVVRAVDGDRHGSRPGRRRLGVDALGVGVRPAGRPAAGGPQALHIACICEMVNGGVEHSGAALALS